MWSPSYCSSIAGFNVGRRSTVMPQWGNTIVRLPRHSEKISWPLPLALPEFTPLWINPRRYKDLLLRPIGGQAQDHIGLP